MATRATHFPASRRTTLAAFIFCNARVVRRYATDSGSSGLCA